MADAYAWWRTALAEPHKIGTPDLPIHDDTPHVGYFRARQKDAPDVPVAIWRDQDGELIAMRGAREVRPTDVWTWACRSPVNYEEYIAARETGRWPDDPPAVTRADEPKAGIGHNRPEDPVDAMREDLASEREQATEFLRKPIVDQTSADMAAAWAKRLAALSKKADDMRKVEKQPHMDAAKAVDERFREIIEDAKEFSTKLKRHLDDWLREQARIEAERQRKAREEAEKARREAEEAARKAALAADAAAQDERAREAAERAAKEAADRAAAAEREAQARKTGAGRTGSKVALTTKTRGEITDRAAFLDAVKDRPEVAELLESLCNRAARSGIELPGMKIVKYQEAA